MQARGQMGWSRQQRHAHSKTTQQTLRLILPVQLRRTSRTAAEGVNVLPAQNRDDEQKLWLAASSPLRVMQLQGLSSSRRGARDCPTTPHAPGCRSHLAAPRLPAFGSSSTRSRGTQLVCRRAALVFSVGLRFKTKAAHYNIANAFALVSAACNFSTAGTVDTC